MQTFNAIVLLLKKKYSISFVPDQLDNLFPFPNGNDVLDDPLFYNNDNSVNNKTNVDSVLDNNDKYGVIYDRTNDANPSSLPSESSMPYIHSIIGEVNKVFQFWTNIPNGEPYDDNDNTYNDTVPN